jgi:hypothetical protein
MKGHDEKRMVEIGTNTETVMKRQRLAVVTFEIAKVLPKEGTPWPGGAPASIDIGTAGSVRRGTALTSAAVKDDGASEMGVGNGLTEKGVQAEAYLRHLACDEAGVAGELGESAARERAMVRAAVGRDAPASDASTLGLEATPHLTRSQWKSF